MNIRKSEAVFKYHGFTQPSPLGSLGLWTLNLFPNGLKPKPIRHTGMFCAAAHHELKMLWIWLQLLAFVTHLVSFLLFPISFFSLYLFPLFYISYFLISKSFSGFKLLFLRQSLLSDIASLALSVLNHNPVNPTSNGVYWERYLTSPLGWFFGCVITIKTRTQHHMFDSIFRASGESRCLITRTNMDINYS